MRGCGCLLVAILTCAGAGAFVWYQPDFPHRTEVLAGLAGVPALLLVLALIARAIRRQRILGMSLRKIDRMEGEEFEHWIAAVLRLQGWRVEVMGGSGDFGVDLVAVRRGRRWGIQAKRHRGKVSNSAVQEARAGADYHDCDHAAVVTNSRFTKAARQQAEKMKPPVGLVGREDLHSVGEILSHHPN